MTTYEQVLRLRDHHADELAAMTPPQVELLDEELGLTCEALDLMRNNTPNLLEASRLEALARRAHPPREVYRG